MFEYFGDRCKKISEAFGYGCKDTESVCQCSSALRTITGFAAQDVATRYTREGFCDTVLVCVLLWA